MYWNCIRRFSFGATTKSESPISRKIPTGHQNFFLRLSLISARHGTAPWWLFFLLVLLLFWNHAWIAFCTLQLCQEENSSFFTPQKKLAQILENFPLRTPIPPVFSPTCQRVGENPGNETLSHWAASGKAQYISDVIRDRDKELWGKITDTQCLKDLLPSKLKDRSLRQRGHDYILPRIRTEHFKRCVFLTLFSFMFVRKFVFVEIISLLLHCKLARVPASVWIKLSIKIFNSIHSIFYKNLSYRTFSLKFAKISRTVLRTRRTIYFSLLLLCKIQKNWIT